MVFAVAMSVCAPLAWGGVDLGGLAETWAVEEMIDAARPKIIANEHSRALLRNVYPSNIPVSPDSLSFYPIR